MHPDCARPHHMWGALPLALLLSIGCAAQEDAVEEPSSDPDAGVVQISPFTGTWVVTELEGEKAPRQDLWTFTEDSVDIDSAFGEFHGTFTFDSEALPHELDILLDSFAPGQAIYRFLDEDTMVLMMDDGAGMRADHFEVGLENYDHIRFIRYFPPE